MFLLKNYSIYKVQTLKEYASASNQRSVIQWPRGLRHRSVGARLLGLRVRIPLGMEVRLSLVSGVCCQVEVSASGWSLVQRNLIKYGVSEC